MRPILADGKAARRSFRIGFDQENAQIIRLVGREIAQRRIDHFVQIAPESLRKMRPHYAAQSQANPSDPAAKKYLEVIDRLAPQ